MYIKNKLFEPLCGKNDYSAVFLFNVIIKVLRSPNLDIHLGGPGINIPLDILVVMKKKIKKIFGNFSHGCPRVY